MLVYVNVVIIFNLYLYLIIILNLYLYLIIIYFFLTTILQNQNFDPKKLKYIFSKLKCSIKKDDTYIETTSTNNLLYFSVKK